MKNTFLVLVLIFAGFLSIAQNRIMNSNHINPQFPQWEYTDFYPIDVKIPTLPHPKTNTRDDWWQPDTLINYNLASEQPWDRTIYSYNSQGFVTVQLIQRLQAGIWKNYWKFSFTYDAKSNLLTDLSQRWKDEMEELHEIYLYLHLKRNPIFATVARWEVLWEAATS